MTDTLHTDLVKVDVVKVNFDRGELHLSFDYRIQDKPKSSFTRLVISEPDKMVEEFWQHLLETPPLIGREAVIKDASKGHQHLSHFLGAYVGALSKYENEGISEHELAILNTNGLDLENPGNSFYRKRAGERIESFMKQAEKLFGERSFFLALETLNKVLKLDPEFMDAYRVIGNCHLALEEFADAENAYRRWMELAVGKRDPFFAIGDVLLAQHRYNDALKLYDEYCETFEGDMLGLIEKAQIYFKLRSDKYIRLLDRAYLEKPDVVREHIRGRWKFSQIDNEKKHYLSPRLARAFLNMPQEEFSELVKNGVIPSYFDEDECRYYFNRDELYAWAEIVSRYEVYEKKYRVDFTQLKEEVDLIRLARKRDIVRERRKKLHKKYLPPASQIGFEFN